ncbi:MAG: MFS transporter [Armatimonadetes bacterium CG_4_10_14_3_um_filter_66_18]|nr:MAG: hypothetical protein AUJ96_27365 [Armatimonadetes bacterium CG2_30_66_41]PIY37655.1 MAG: MFS transporter [Armatimonadetes bacterium CG_4_10_14_3_um_filter_66_18]PJB63454.1 MAG: MFS transporter [Armatimonadetes bacterium CG_4_9_14_3_um_filter_66_14]
MATRVQESRAPPMKNWKRTFYAVCLAQVCAITGFSFVLPFMPFFIRELGVTDPAAVARWAGIVSAATAVTMGIFGPIWGVLADRYGRKPMVVRAMFGGMLVLLLMSLSRTVIHLTLCRLLQGALTGTMTANIALVASVAPRERSGYALGMMQAAVFVGMSVGPLFGGLVADHFGYRATFLAAAVLLVIGGIVVSLFAEENFTPVSRDNKDEQGSFAEVLAATGFVAALAALFVIRFANSITAPVFPLLVEQIHGATRLNTVTGGIISVGGFASAVFSGILGRFSDTWGHRRLLILSSTLTGVVAGLHVFAQSVTHLVILRLLFGIGASGVMPAANAIIRNGSEDRNIGKAYGLSTAATSLGWAAGPLAGGSLAASMGLRAPFALMGASLVLAAVVVAVLVRKEPNSHDGSPGV